MNAAQLQSGLTALSDLTVALSSGLANIPQDEAVLGDALALAGVVDPAIIPFEVLLPVAEILVAFLIATNKLHQQRMISTGGRGSNPWTTHG